MRALGSRWRAVLLWILLVAGPAAAVPLTAQQQPPKRPAQDEFVPIDELPPQEQLPAAPLLIAAYSVAWVLVAGYLFSIWRRMGRVEHELAEVGRRVQQRRPPVS
jgi:CcmD family protein